MGLTVDWRRWKKNQWLEDRIVEMVPSGKRKEKIGDSDRLGDLWYIMNHFNVIGVTGGEEKKTGTESNH